MNKRILEALLGLILIILLVMMAFLITQTDKEQTASTTITNSFNKNYHSTPQKDSQIYYKKTNYDYLDYHTYSKSHPTYKKTYYKYDNDYSDYHTYPKYKIYYKEYHDGITYKKVRYTVYDKKPFISENFDVRPLFTRITWP